jgi:hypothetical protein
MKPFGLALMIVGAVCFVRPNILRGGIFMKTSLTIRLMKPETYENYMRSLGMTMIVVGFLLAAILT